LPAVLQWGNPLLRPRSLNMSGSISRSRW